MNKILNTIFLFLRTSVRRFKAFFNEYAAKTIDVLETVKVIIDNPTMDVLVELTKSKLDDELLKILRRALNIFFTGDIYPINPTAEDVLKQIELLSKMPKEQRNASLFKIGSIMIRELAKKSKQEITATEADTLLQLSYKAAKDGKYFTV